MNPTEFKKLQELPYEKKIAHAGYVAADFYYKMNGKVFCSVGGLDSIVLLSFLRENVSPDIPGASISIIEDKSIQDVHKTFDNFVFLKPLKSKISVLRELGYPIISKDRAKKIHAIQNPSIRNATVRHAIITGEMGKLGGFKQRGNGSITRLPQKWLNLFGGPENEKYGTNYKTAPFKVSHECCYWLKEKPANIYAKETGRVPFLGLMASEGGQRRGALMSHGCNYYGKTTVRSCPFAIFSHQDLLQLAIDMNIKIPSIYGNIERGNDGVLRTTKAQRTGCSMCGFGIHLEKRPHRFDRLREDNEKEWHFWMYKMGWGIVLSYIGVDWE